MAGLEDQYKWVMSLLDFEENQINNKSVLLWSPDFSVKVPNFTAPIFMRVTMSESSGESSLADIQMKETNESSLLMQHRHKGQENKEEKEKTSTTRRHATHLVNLNIQSSKHLHRFTFNLNNTTCRPAKSSCLLGCYRDECSRALVHARGELREKRTSQQRCRSQQD